MALLAEDSDVSDAARSLKREMLRDLGHRAGARRDRAGGDRDRFRRLGAAGRAAVGGLPATGEPLSRPDFSAVPQLTSRPRRLANWELLGPLLSSFERAGGGAPAAWRSRRRRHGSPRRAWS
jgi:hypothetical protein